MEVAINLMQVLSPSCRIISDNYSKVPIEDTLSHSLHKRLLRLPITIVPQDSTIATRCGSGGQSTGNLVWLPHKSNQSNTPTYGFFA